MTAPTLTPEAPTPASHEHHSTPVQAGIFSPKSLISALPQAFSKLDPRLMIRTPVMFVVLIGSVLTTVLAVMDPSLFSIAVAIWLWLTVIFANLAEAVAEGRGRAQAASLRATRSDTPARRLREDGSIEEVPATTLKLNDRVVCEGGDVIPSDGDVVEGAAAVDESAITGESAPVIRESGGDRSAVTGGTRVLSDRIVIRITAEPGKTFLDRMIALVEGSARSKTPNEIALGILLSVLTIIFLLAVVTLAPMANYVGSPQSIVVLISLLVCLIPTTIGALLSAIGVAGMDRLVQRNVLAMSGRAVEAAGDVSTLLMDKTGTITYGNRYATDLIPAPGVEVSELATTAHLASLADETPEGRSIVELCERDYAIAPVSLDHPSGLGAAAGKAGGEPTWVQFTALTRMSGVDLHGQQIRKGAAAAVKTWVINADGSYPDKIDADVERVAQKGGTPLLVAVDGRVLGVIQLTDVVKPGIRERFAELREMGIRSVMVTGDGPLTAKAIGEEAGVDEVISEATPEDKLAYIKAEQQAGRIVAMTGDGTNDAPALAQADVGVAMNSGTAAAKEAGNMVDLDSTPTKLLEIVKIGKQLLITRGALTTFSIANDIAKYFAILPAMFAGAIPGLNKLNIMQLHSPTSAVLSAVIFNALIITALIPLALRGVRYRPSTASALLRRNLLLYGVGGLIAPFIGIKIIDLLVSLLPGM